MKIYIVFISVLITSALLRYFFKNRGKITNNPTKIVNTTNLTNSNSFQESRVKVIENNIYIKNDPSIRSTDVEIFPVFKLDNPQLYIYEDNNLLQVLKIESRNGCPEISGRYLHSSIRINTNSSFQMDGIISDNPDIYDKDGEGIRFQPFFLSNKESSNTSLKGLGLFQRGLHFSGYITPLNIRFVCICDECRNSFSLEFIHAGFSELQYYYSADSKEILFVPYGKIENLPIQLQKNIDIDLLTAVEQKLPLGNNGRFKYYNGLKCPHCSSQYIDFENNKESRPNEYYANFYLNQKPLYFN